jgi:hypothetical protein
MSDIFDWKDLSFVANTGAATFGVIVPATMHMELKDIDYANLTTGVAGSANQVIVRQIPSGVIRPSTSIIIDQQNVQANMPYAPKAPIRTIQENCVIEASTTVGPMIVSLAYRLRYGRP